MGPKIGYEAIGIVDSSLKTVSVWASAMEADTPKAAAESSGTGIRSEVQDEVPFIGRIGKSYYSFLKGAAVADNTAKKEEKSDEASSSDGGIPGQSELEEADELDFGKGIVFYMKNQKVVGVICWNIFNQIPVARRVSVIEPIWSSTFGIVSFFRSLTRAKCTKMRTRCTTSERLSKSFLEL